MNKELQKIGSTHIAPGRGGKRIYNPLFPKLTSYWARHTWATIAASIDIPNEVIAEALGHEYGNRITNIYIRFDIKKVDRANRKVLDWVLYGKIDDEVVVKPGTPEFFGLSEGVAVSLGLCKAPQKVSKPEHFKDSPQSKRSKMQRTISVSATTECLHLFVLVDDKDASDRRNERSKAIAMRHYGLGLLFLSARCRHLP